MKGKYRYFDWRDWERCTPRCSEIQMNDRFLKMLDKARHKAGIPFIINSAYRNVAWEKAMGRTGTSSHTKGVAVDIKCNCSYDRLIIVKALLDVGFKRIGIYDSFIHVDNDDSKIDCLFLS